MPDISNDDLIREIMDMREKGRHEEASRLYQAEKKGELQGKVEIAKNLLTMHLPLEKISQATGLSIEEINNLHHKG